MMASTVTRSVKPNQLFIPHILEDKKKVLFAHPMSESQLEKNIAPEQAKRLLSYLSIDELNSLLSSMNSSLKEHHPCSDTCAGGLLIGLCCYCGMGFIMRDRNFKKNIEEDMRYNPIISSKLRRFEVKIEWVQPEKSSLRCCGKDREGDEKGVGGLIITFPVEEGGKTLLENSEPNLQFYSQKPIQMEMPKKFQ